MTKTTETEPAPKLSLEGLVFEAIQLDIQDHIMTITLNRPEKKNAINPVMSNEIIYALDYAAQETAIRVVVIAANGNVFCAGADLRAMSGGSDNISASNVPSRGDTDAISLRLRHLCKPVVAKIQGSVFAGALLLVCNATHAIAVPEAQFAAPEILRGIWPCMVMASLFRLMPKRAGLDFIMRGQAISASQAQSWGLVSETVAAENLDEHVNTLARELAALPPTAMRLGLKAYIDQEFMDFDEALPMLRARLQDCVQSADAKEGIAAFLEKRPAKW